MKDEVTKQLRYFLKDEIRLETDFKSTDEQKGISAPPIEKSCLPGAQKIPLPSVKEWKHIGDLSVKQAIAQRQSRRKFSDQPLSLEELAYLLWCTQGVREWKNGVAFRTAPSAGCRHALETYVVVFNVAGLEPGIYRYLPSTHQLIFESAPVQLKEKLIEATALHMPFISSGAVTFIWTAIPYRMEWRYAEASYKVIALDAGHVCQNLYLACESIDAGTCAIAANHQDAANCLLNVDGQEEFVVYMAPVGKKQSN